MGTAQRLGLSARTRLAWVAAALLGFCLVTTHAWAAQGAEDRGVADQGAAGCPELRLLDSKGAARSVESLTLDELRALDRRMRGAPDHCFEVSSFLEQRVAVSLRLGDLVSALTWSEKRVMVDPDSPAALMDYAWVARLSDQTQLARGILEQLVEREDLPVALKPQVVAWLAEADGAAGADGADGAAGFWSGLGLGSSRYRVLAGHTVVGAMLGYETNLNNGPSSADIALTFPTGDYIFELDRSEVARPGPVLSAYGQWSASIARGLTQVGDLRISAQARQPLVGGQSYVTQVAELNAGILPRNLWQAGSSDDLLLPSRVWGQVSQYGYAGSLLMSAVSVGSNWVIEHPRLMAFGGAKRGDGGAGGDVASPNPKPLQEAQIFASLTGCASQPGLWAEARRYPSRPDSDANILGVSYALTCRDLERRYVAEAFISSDMAQGSRLGGYTRRYGLSVSVHSLYPFRPRFLVQDQAQAPNAGVAGTQDPIDWPAWVGEGISWAAFARMDRALDQRSYSDLLDFGNRRSVGSVTIGAHASAKPTGQPFKWVLRAERRLQKSNIDLFDNEATTIGLGLELALD